MSEIFEVYIQDAFEAAHSLPHVPEGHKCARLHGHSFRVKITVQGPLDEETGWVVDFADIKAVWKDLFRALDHHNLNEIEGLKNPTSENIARWIGRNMEDYVPGLKSVEIKETEKVGAVWYQSPGKLARSLGHGV